MARALGPVSGTSPLGALAAMRLTSRQLASAVALAHPEVAARIATPALLAGFAASPTAGLVQAVAANATMPCLSTLLRWPLGGGAAATQASAPQMFADVRILWAANLYARLHLRGVSDLAALDVGRLAGTLERMPQLQHLELTGNALGQEALALPWHALPRLHTLSLAGNRLAPWLGEIHLAAPRTLRTLELGHNWLGQGAGPEGYLGQFTNLQTLRLNDNGIATPDLARLGVAGCRRLCRLDLAYNAIGDGKLEHLGELLPPDGSLRWLDLTHNHLSYAHLAALGAPSFAGLRTLRLGHNALGAAGAAQLTLHALPHLQTLDLSGNNLGEAGVRRLALHAHKDLQELNLADNALGARRPLDELGLPWTQLRELDLSRNSLGTRRLASLPFAKMTRLQVLNLSRNELSAEPVWAAIPFERLDALQTLDLSENRLGLRGVLTARLANMPKLRQLRLAYNPVQDRDDSEDLKKGLEAANYNWFGPEPDIGAMNRFWQKIGALAHPLDWYALAAQGLAMHSLCKLEVVDYRYNFGLSLALETLLQRQLTAGLRRQVHFRYT